MPRAPMTDAVLVQRAASFAAFMHDGQVRRYTGEPYFVHCEAVATLLRDHGLPPPVVAAGYLHDTMEDCGLTRRSLADLFGERVATLVNEVTDISTPSHGNRAARKALDCAHLASASPDGASLKLADLIDNTTSIVAHDPKFAKVYLAEKRAMLAVLTHGAPSLFALASAVTAMGEMP